MPQDVHSSAPRKQYGGSVGEFNIVGVQGLTPLVSEQEEMTASRRSQDKNGVITEVPQFPIINYHGKVLHDVIIPFIVCVAKGAHSKQHIIHNMYEINCN